MDWLDYGLITYLSPVTHAPLLRLWLLRTTRLFVRYTPSQLVAVLIVTVSGYLLNVPYVWLLPRYLAPLPLIAGARCWTGLLI